MTTLAQISALFTTAGLAAAGAAAMAIPIAIHLLTRLRRRQQPWAAMRFLMEAYRRQRQRVQIEQWLLLLVRCLIMLALGFALAGPLLGGLAKGMGVNASGRIICLVIDDSLSTQAEREGGKSRFDDLRRQGIRLLDSLGPADRVALWRAARPQRAELSPLTVDHARARQLLVEMKPRFSAADWPGALASVAAMLKQQRATGDRATVVMLSDFAAGTLDASRAPPPEAVEIGRFAKLLVARPMPESANVQVAALTPRRQMIVIEGATRATTVPVELRLRRFVAEQPDALTGIDLALIGNDPQAPIATLRREHRWSAGQNAAVLNFEVPVPAAWLNSPSAPQAGAGVTLTLRARIDTGTSPDAIAADNERLGVIELRRRLAVGLIDQSAALDPAQPGVLRPRDWLRLALAPESRQSTASTSPATSRPIEITEIAAASTDDNALANLDAAMVLRPDLLGTRGWNALRDLAQRGGLVWIFMPPTDSPGTWAAALQENFGLDWKLGLAAKAAPGEAGETSASWNVVADDPLPEPLGVLGGDWAAMLRPIHVMKRVEVVARGGQDTVWLRVAEADPKTPSALLTSASVGDGRVLLLATALDTTWTNLTTKPLFVPLLHETLRGVLGSTGDAARLSKLTVGDQPLLGKKWDAAQGVMQPSGAAIRLLRSDQGLQPNEPLELPGIYTAQSGEGLKLAVNVEASAGNTQSLDTQALARWLDGLGSWTWIEPDRPEVALQAESPRTNLGWPLLWATLALVLLETGLARWFSHAKT